MKTIWPTPGATPLACFRAAAAGCCGAEEEEAACRKYARFPFNAHAASCLFPNPPTNKKWPSQKRTHQMNPIAYLNSTLFQIELLSKPQVCYTMLSLPQPSNFLIVDLPGAATSSSSAEESAWRKAPPVRNIQGRKRNDLAPKLNSQPREEGWLGETRNRPCAWPCSPGAGEGSRPRGPLVCSNGSCSAHPGRINQVGPGENRIAGTPIQWQWTSII